MKSGSKTGFKAKRRKVRSSAKSRKKSNKGSGRSEAERPRNILIVRSSGRKEKFDADRMAQTISRSGTPFMMARDIAKKVSRKVRATSSSLNTKKGRKEVAEVEGGKVRRLVAEELRERNRPDIASSYTGEKPENTRQGRHSLMNENEPVLDNVAANRSKLLYDGTSYFAKSTRSRSK
jgi:transcriptional regulator NrdR family protein